MDNLTPITREEILMNDEPLTPITREEKILAGEDLNPVTRREYFLKKYRHAGGDVMVEGLSVTANGTYTAPEGKAYSPVEVAVPLPDNAYLLKTASGSLVSFSDGADLPMPSFICNIDAVQDLHGYDYPWVGGAGKNKLPLVLADIKALNTNGTWSGNTYTYNNIDYTIITDTDNNIIGIKATGTASANSALNLCVIDTSSDMILNGCPANGNSSTYRLATSVINKSDYGNGVTLMNGSNVTPYIIINTNYTCPTAGLMFYPMIRLATETDPTFAPYSNICPISGHTGVDAWVRGKNLLDITTITIDGFTFIEDIDGYVSASPNNSDNRIWSYDKSQYKLIIPAGDWKLVIETKTPTSANSRGIIIWDSANNAIRELWADSYNSVGIKTINFTLTEKTNIGIMTKMYDAVARFMIVPQSASNDFEFYNFDSQTIQVSWQTEAGEVFGGYVDLVSGELTVTHKSQTGFTRGSQDSSNKLYNIGTISDMKAYTTASAISPYFVDSMFEKMSVQGARIAETPSIAHYNKALYVGGYIGKESELDTLLETLQVKYELETPLTYQLTPTQIKSLLGKNNAWCSTGDVDIDYFAKEVTG